MMNRGDRSAFRRSPVTIICGFLFIVNSQWDISAVIAEECTHNDCSEAATQLSESINVDIDPCDDFVEFACGNAFAKDENTTSSKKDPLSSETFLMPSSKPHHTSWVRQELVKELNKPYRSEEPRAVGLAKMYWQSCKITSAKEALVGVRTVLKRLGGWPLITEAWQEQHFTWEKFSKCARRIGFLPRMFVHIGLNGGHVEKPWSTNDSIELTIERSKYMITHEDMIKTMGRAAEYLKIADYLAGNKKPDPAEIEEALQFGKRVHSLTYSQETPIIEQKLMSIAQLQTTYPFINWMDYIRSMLTRGQANRLSDRNCVIADVPYLSQIGNLLQSTDKRVQANYAFLSIIDDLSLFIRPQLSLVFADDQREIERICFDSVSSIFDKPIETILATMVGENVRQKVRELRTTVAQKAREIFNSIPWMDHQTRLQATKKSQKTSFIDLFADDLFQDSTFDRLEFTQPDATLVLFREVNVFLVNRYYLQLGRPRNSYILHRGHNNTMFAIFKTPFSSTETMVRPDRISNQVYIPAAATLHGRFKVLRELNFLNYATMGLQIADAMGHQIYQRGSFIDSNSRWGDVSWWSESTRKQFASRQSCMEIGKVEPPIEISPIFGFIGAAEIAYKSMLEDRGNSSNVTLPGLKYSMEQLFWIAAVAQDCDENLSSRYNTVLAHNYDFARDFNCPIGSMMNIVEKCQMWI